MTTTNEMIDLYKYTQKDAPADVVVNIGGAAILIGGSEHVTKDSARIDPGDRRQGAYYLDILERTPDAVKGLVPVNKVPQKQLDKVDRKRQERVGARAPKWVEKARAKAEADGEPPVFDKQKAAMVGIQRKKITEQVNEAQAAEALGADIKDFTSTGYADEA